MNTFLWASLQEVLGHPSSMSKAILEWAPNLVSSGVRMRKEEKMQLLGSWSHGQKSSGFLKKSSWQM